MRGITNRSTTRRLWAALGVAVVLGAATVTGPSVATAAPPGPIVAIGGLGVGVERISIATDEGYGAASITPDGRNIVFTSSKNGPSQGGNEVYVHDRRTARTRTEPLVEGWTPAISGDGRQVAVNVPAQGMTAPQIRQHSIDLGLLPVACSRCNQPSLSADGRYLAFGLLRYPQLYRSVLVADRNGGYETIAELGSGAPARPSISDDGRYVAYQDLTYQKQGVYLWDRTTGATSGPLQSPSTSALLVQLSDDGSKVVYQAGSDTYVHDVSSGNAQQVPNVKAVAIDPTGRYLLHTPNTPGGPSLALRDLQTGTDETVSDQPATAEVDSVSAGGRDVVFQSTADGIVPEDTNGVSDVFVRRFF